MKAFFLFSTMIFSLAGPEIIQTMLLLFSIFLATILIGSAYIITEKNARYYLSGYWNLKPADREKVLLN